MKVKIIIFCTLFALLQTVVLGQKTEVKVNEGLVKVQTDTGERLVHPGQIASLRQGKNPDIKIDDPLVDDAIALYEAAKKERADGGIDYSLISVQSYAIENNGKAHGAFATEFTNYRDYPMNLCLIGETFMPKENKYYGMDGQKLDFESDAIAPNLGFFYLHYPTTVKPSDAFEFVATFEMNANLSSLKKADGHYEYTAGEGTPDSLAYYRVILPKGAEFIECRGNVDLLKVDSNYGKVGLTIKGHKSRHGSKYTIVFNIKDEYLLDAEQDALNYSNIQQMTAQFQSEIETVLAESKGDWLKVYDYVVEKDYKWVKALSQLAIQLVMSGHYEQALDIYTRIVNSMNRTENPYALTAIIWQGHLLDMQGKRQEAIEKYKTALDIYPRYARGPSCYDQWGIILNEDWVKERIRKPFTEQMLKTKL